MTKHTPGPWSNGTFIDINGAPSIGFNIGHSNQRTDESLANARLIDAAPEMLDALEAIASYKDGTLMPEHAIECFKDRARDALAKAKGE